MLRRSLPFVLLVAGIAFITPVAGQAPLPKPPVPGQPPLPKPPLPAPPAEAIAALQKLTGAKGAELDQAVRGIAVYPQRTRNAILDLAHYAQKHPTLLADLAKLRTGPADAIDRYLTTNKYEAELQHAAALVLVEAPETVDRMQERPEMVRIVGIAWSTPPGRQLIGAVLDGAAANQEKTRSAAADRWTARLKADPKLMQQYTQLLDDYTHRTTAADQQPDETWKSYGYGTYKTKDGYVVDDVPSQEVINYALAVGTQYQAVAAALIQQYLTGKNQDDYNAAVGGWYAANSDSIPQSSRQDNSDYYALLQELSRLADSLNASNSGSGDNSGSGNDSGNNSGNNSGNDSGNNSGDGSGNSGSAAGNFLNANVNNFPKLSNWVGKNPVPKLGSPADLTRLKDGPTGKPPFDPSKVGPSKTPGASPFGDRMKATPAGDRARAMPHGGQNPFQIASRPGSKPSVGKQPGGTPHQLFRGSPSMGQQLTRAPGRMGASWHPRGGAGPRPGGGPRR